jgi:threo-3-hydroxy-L-aspartate ammonia-lyase
VEAASERIKGIAIKTPVMTSRTINTMTGATVYFKCEQLQRTGAFKFRGALNTIKSLDPDARKRGVLAYSSGNHAQAIALAGKILGVPTTIVMPHDAPELKAAATAGYGAEIVRFDRYKEDREIIATSIASERGFTLIPPYDHPEVIAGQGTAVKELIEEAGELDVLVVCLGGGGLLAGSALSARALSPKCRIIGVEPEAGDDGRQSLKAGKIIRIQPPRSIADGAIVTHLGQHTFPIIQREVSSIETVTDHQLITVVKLMMERMKLVVEPTGCLAAAAVICNVIPVKDMKVGVILSGGNVDASAFAKYLA